MTSQLPSQLFAARSSTKMEVDYGWVAVVPHDRGLDRYIKVDAGKMRIYPPLSRSQIVKSKALTSQREKIESFKRGERLEHPVLKYRGMNKKASNKKETSRHDFKGDEDDYSTHNRCWDKNDGMAFGELPPLSVSAAVCLANKKKEAQRVIAGFQDKPEDGEAVKGTATHRKSLAPPAEKATPRKSLAPSGDKATPRKSLAPSGNVIQVEDVEYTEEVPHEEKQPNLLARMRWKKAFRNIHRYQEKPRFNRRVRHKMIAPLDLPSGEQRSRLLDEGNYDRWHISKPREQPKSSIGDVVLQLRGVKGSDLKESPEEIEARKKKIALFLTKQMFTKAKADAEAIQAGPSMEPEPS